MNTVWLHFPDPILRDALLATFQAAWPELQWRGETPPEKLPVHDIILSDSELPHHPSARVLVLENGKNPPKLKTILRQIESMLHQMTSPDEITVLDATLDTRTREWSCGDTHTALTEKEVALIVHLAVNGSATREELLRNVWRYANDVDTHTIETHIYRLRQKIESDPAEPRYLVTTKDGYQLAAVSSA